MMVRGKSAIEAYQWSSHSSEWVKVGEVTGGVSEKEGSNKKKKIYKGKVCAKISLLIVRGW